MDNLTDQNYNEVISKEEMVGVLMFADWCEPSKNMIKTLSEASQKISHPFYQCNIDEAISKIEEIEIRGVPTFIIYKNGQEYRRNVGLINKDDLLKMFE